MTGLIKNMNRNIRLAALLALGVAGFAPTNASADEPRYGDRYGKDYRYGDERRYDRSDRNDDNRWHDSRDRHYDRRRDSKTDVRVEIDLGGRPAPRIEERRVRYWVEPEFKVVRERVWIEPVHKTVTERVWIAPVYRTEYEEVYVPAEYEVRERVIQAGRTRFVQRDRVLVREAYTKRVAREVCVTEGRWEVITKQICVAPGRWDHVEKQVCVTQGRWDYRVERVEFGREQQTRLDLRF